MVESGERKAALSRSIQSLWAEKSAGVLLASSRFTSSILLSTQVADVPLKRVKIAMRGS
jgi:hypothetical protein